MSQRGPIVYTEEELALVDLQRIPHHVAIIPDGNRRWAKKRKTKTEEGHRNGTDIVLDVVKAAKELGIKVLTMYTFSTENWLRSKAEVAALMRLLNRYLITQREEMASNGIRLETIGNIAALPQRVQKSLQKTKEATQHGRDVDLVLALNYGGRDEITRAVRAMLKDLTSNGLKEDEINEQTISHYLDTTQWPDPDLLIRTSGELRLSNFFLWQCSYTEIYVSDVLWPDFTPKHLLEAIMNYQQRERRLGKA